ncbi:hypothetical protein CsSME_00008899 [Camellia sinensis var. sinensis]
MGSLKKVWLSGNKFTGRIPESFGQIPHLIELHIEKNEFSGLIPPMEQSSLISLDLSDNKLEGEIPASMSRFDPGTFKGNPGLCGKPVGKECTKQAAVDNGQDEVEAPPPMNKSTTGWVVIGLIGFVLLLTIFFRSKQREDRFDRLGKENLDEIVEVRIRSSNRRSSVDSSLSQKGGGGGSTRRGSSRHGKGMGDLVVVNEERGFFGCWGVAVWGRHTRQ